MIYIYIYINSNFEFLDWSSSVSGRFNGTDKALQAFSAKKTEQNEGGCVGGGREWVSEGCAMGCLSVLALGSVFPMNVGEGNVCTRG